MIPEHYKNFCYGQGEVLDCRHFGERGCPKSCNYAIEHNNKSIKNEKSSRLEEVSVELK